MDEYKNILKNKQTRLKILKLLSFVPDKLMIKIQYKIKLGRKLNLKNPKRYTEKLQWYKLNYRNPLMTKCVDKYEVREYVKSKGLENILNELYGVYNNTEEIDYNTLPKQFIMKTTNGSGGNDIVICKNKDELNIEETNNILNKSLKNKTANLGREWAYKNIKPRVIVEKLLIDKTNKDEGLADYRFFCFNGKPEYILYGIGEHDDRRLNFYDTKWNKIELKSVCENTESEVEKPKELEKMLKIAEKLSKDFPAVRVDLYYVNDKIYFGELTFYHQSGYSKFEPDNFDYILGEKFDLSTCKGKSEK